MKSKPLAKINFVTDEEEDQEYSEGEILAGFDEVELEKYVKEYGYTALLESMTFLSHQIWTVIKKIESEEE